jgi:hypothetical protein
MVFSLTNPSLIGLEMMACGLPCVELASESMVASFGRDGPLALAEPRAEASCAGVERLLDDQSARHAAARAGDALLRERDWRGAAVQVDRGMQEAVSARR